VKQARVTRSPDSEYSPFMQIYRLHSEMPDVFSKEKRSQVMSAIRSKRNKTTEPALMLLFKKNKIKGWRRGSKLIGKPDFVFPDSKLVVFVDGCYWHGHNCRKLKPGANYEYWKGKILRNKRRDQLFPKN
jgi:DNA mismatch endonuclease, patch repair protein